jgi:hypothetical protein
MAEGQSDKAQALLMVAHAQYRSDMRIRESRTPHMPGMSQFSGGHSLDTLLENEDDDEVEPPTPQSPRTGTLTAQGSGSEWGVEEDGESNNEVSATTFENQAFGAEVFASWDFGKQKEYSCREQVMPALVSIMF